MKRWQGYFKEAARQETARGKAARGSGGLVIESAEDRSLYAEYVRSVSPQVGMIAARPIQSPGEKVIDDSAETIDSAEQAAFDTELEADEKRKDEMVQGISSVVLGEGETPS